MSRGERKRRDDRWETLKRRVQLLARLDGGSVWLEEGLHVVSLDAIPHVDRVIATLRERGRLDRAALGGSPVAVDVQLLATAQRDLRALATQPARALAREHKKALARHGVIDDAWLVTKAARVEALALELGSRPRDAWFDRVLELASIVHGPKHAAALAEAGARLTALGPERQRRARHNVELLARALEGEPAPADLAPLAERLERARELPGRARRSRVLDVLRKAIGWAEAPADATHAVGDAAALAAFPDAVRRAGAALARAMPAARDPKIADGALALLAAAGLRYRIGDDGVPLLTEEDVARVAAHEANLGDLERIDVTLAQALALAPLPVSRYPRRRLGRVVAKGLELDLVQRAAAEGQLDRLVLACDHVRSARAFATWAAKLVPHYKALGLAIELSPELFANLPKNEDLGVLAYCLVEADRKGRTTADPMAVLDATLGLFQKLPAKASGIVARLRGTSPGAGRAAFPELAAWLDDDALLDRYVHLARLAGVPAALSKRLREDFDHAEKSARERAHLEALPARSSRQQARLAALAGRDRSLAASPRARTQRRLAERVEALLPLAYRRELDAAFRAILDDGWGIRVPHLTPAWRDAVRFWLVVDDNRELLGQLLREAAAAPGRDVKRRFPRNVKWIERAPFRVDAWLRPRREVLPGGLVLELEEDPLEVLRMGMPFGTCLALDTGFNAASTVVNAVDANKRVLYVRSREGKVLARKLLASTPDAKLVGYHLYVSVAGADEKTIRDAVLRTCRAIGEETGLPLANTGREPERLHGEFWYDDGTEPFDEDVDVNAYCRALGLTPPAKEDSELETEARGQAAIGRGDVDAAIVALATWDRGPANVRLGRWIVDRLGRREAIRRANDHAEIAPALLDAHDEASLFASLELATRLPERVASHALARAFVAFPPSERLCEALVAAARRGLRSGGVEHGVAHLAFTALPDMLASVGHALELLDEVEPIWASLVENRAHCTHCRSAAEESVFAAVAKLDARAPDDTAVTACLRSRRPSELAQRAALRVAARRVLPGGAAAVARALALRPSLGSSPDAFAARIRQGDTDVSDLARLAEPPFEALGDLVLVPWVAPLLACRRDVGTWRPGPWELAFLRRRPDAALLATLRGIAAEAPSRVSRAMELLALLGAAVELASLGLGAGDKVAPPLTMKSRTECETVARSLREQVIAADAGKVQRASSVVDVRLVEVAVTKLVGAARPRERELAIEILGAARFPWEPRLLAARHEDLRELLAKLPPPRQVADVVALWAEPDLRDALVAALAKTPPPDWSARALAAERAGAGGLFEAWALALLANGAGAFAAETSSVDQLKTVLHLAASRTGPREAAIFYGALPDALASALFLRALAPDRLAAMRAAAAELDWKSDRAMLRRAWLDSTRLHKRRSSSIERV